MAKNLVRTPKELNDPAFNYFIAFKIDLKETDKTKIEPLIKKVLSNPKGDVISRRLLELKADVMEIMCEDSLYDEQSETYRENAGGRKKEAQRAKDLKLKDTLGVIQILCKTRTTLMRSEIKNICETVNTPVVFFTLDELENAIKPLLSQGIKIIDNIDKSSIPFDKYKKTEDFLKALDKKDLYDFLGCSVTASNSDIQTSSDELYRNKNKLDLKKQQSVSTLCATVKEVLLASPQARKNYDNYLALKAEVWSEFETRKSFAIKELKFDEYEGYTQKIINTLKVSISEAEKMIGIACNHYGFQIIGAEGGGSNFEECPYPDCGLLFKKGVKSCPHCGKPLEVLCWNCKQKTPFTKDDKGCSSCGATQQSHDMFLDKCAKFESVSNTPDADVTTLQTALLQVTNVVPGYEKNTSSEVYRKVKEFEKLLQAKQKQEETLGAQYKADTTKIRDLIAQKKFQSALAIARSLQQKYGTYNVVTSKKLLTDVQTVVSNAQRNAEQAKLYASQNNESLAISYAIKALEICDDYIEARQILQKYPPKPVQNLRAVLDGNKVRLEWEDRVKQDFATYTIIKKVGVAPTRFDDGAVVESNLSIKFYEDESIVSATPYYYSVYADRYGIKSNLCTTISPVIVYSDVSNLQQDFTLNGVKVVWEAPQNVKSIEVWKKDGPVAPLKAGDGVKVNCDNKGFNDEKCSGESAYLIICNYEVSGRQVQSRGAKIVCKPYENTKPLEDVKIESIGVNKYSFTCADGYAGKISLYYATSKLAVQTNTVLKYIDFNKHCKGMVKLPTTTTVDGKISFSIEPEKILQIYPVVATEQLFVVSPPQLVNSMSGMRAQHTVSNGTVTVTGSVHQKAKNIIVKVSNDKFVDNLNEKGESFTFLADDFRRSGKIEIKLKADTVNYITLFVEFLDDGVKSYSQPVKLEPAIDYREAVSVLFNLEYSPNPAKPFKVTINYEADKEVQLPTMLLMKGRPKPLNKNAGELCERIAPITLKKGFFSKKYTAKQVITVSPTSPMTKFALFVSDGGEYVKLKEVTKL